MRCSFLSCITFIFSFFALLFVAFDFFFLTAFPSFLFGIRKICLNAGRGQKEERKGLYGNSNESVYAAMCIQMAS